MQRKITDSKLYRERTTGFQTRLLLFTLCPSIFPKPFVTSNHRDVLFVVPLTAVSVGPAVARGVLEYATNTSLWVLATKGCGIWIGVTLSFCQKRGG